jgi:UDP-N-acetylmuramoyl-L-alanyl-D-glutamate--2,6-diaminopimelate ligase
VSKQKKLFDILPQGEIRKIYGPQDREVSMLTIDSRTCTKDSLFFAFTGSVTDGHTFIKTAIDKGAGTIVCEKWPDDVFEGVTYVLVKDARKTAGMISDQFFDHVSNKIVLVGVTGTNGKTTVATLLFNLFRSLGHKCGLISTVENKILDSVIPATHTTPDVISLHSLLLKMYESGCTHVFMEVSSHAVHQQRIGGLRFKVALFTNLTQDHLDYHITMSNYINAKKMFFDNLDENSFALVNIDDKQGKIMVQNTKANVSTYSLRTMADFKGIILENNILGLMMKINGEEACFKLIGDFNAYNLLAAYGTAILLGKTSAETLTCLSGLSGPTGRFEQIVDVESGKCGIVDYAHTPDALQNVLDTIKKIKNHASKIITVVGCGGDRDKTKRPVMAKIGVEMSDTLILTSDNPRTEDPESILDDMEKGISSEQETKTLRIADRKAAIKTAVMMAGNNDIILVAGKGHETYQEINGVKTPFDDKMFLSEFLLKNRDV